MDSSHLTEPQIETYRARQLPPADILRLHEHAEGCPACRERLAASAGQELPAHDLAEQELVEFALGRLSATDAARVAAHLENCDRCRDLYECQSRERQGASRPRWLSIAAAVVLVLIPAAYWYSRRAPQATLVAVVRDAGGSIGLTDTGALTGIAGLTDADAATLREILRSGRLPAGPPPIGAPPAAALRSTDGTVSEFHALEPLGRVLPGGPEFRWSLMPGVTSYEVRVFTEDLRPVAASGLVRDTSWRPVQSLPRGQVLLWQVSARTAGGIVTAPAPPAPAARFELVSDAEAAEIARLTAVTPRPHLLLAAAFARAGLTRETAAELDQLAALNEGSGLVRSLREGR